jgi:outer membrane protein assembly factor BamB
VGLGGQAAVKDLLIFGDDQGDVRGLDVQTGAVKWKIPLNQRIYFAPASGGDRIAVGNDDGIAVLNPSGGAIVWRKRLAAGADRCLINSRRNTVYAAGNDGFVHCFDLKTGEDKWQGDFIQEAPDGPKSISAKAKRSDQRARPSGMVCGERSLYVTVFDQMRLVALDLEDGHERGSYLTKGWVFSTPTLDDDLILFGSQDRFLHAVDKTTRQPTWTFKTGARVEADCVSVEGRVYFGSCDGCLYCLDRADGKEVWKFKTEPLGGRTSAIYATPIVKGDEVFFATMEGRLFGLDRRRGEERWQLRIDADSEIEHGLEQHGDLLFLATRPVHEKQGKYAVAAVRH